MSWHYMCLSTAHYCGSGCCSSSRACATTNGTCTYKYSNYNTSVGVYSYPGYYSTQCNTYARNCSTGCCTAAGNCAYYTNQCVYTYSDYSSSSWKYDSLGYSYTGTVNTKVNAGPLAGGIAGGVVALIVLIGLFVWWRKRQAMYRGLNMNNTMNTTTTMGNENNGGTTIIMTNNTPQPVYGMNQPMMQPMQPVQPMQPMMMQPTYTQPFQPVYDPLPNPMMQPPMGEPFMQASYGLGGEPGQQHPAGPIMY